jgi:hypothetical protein
MVNIVTGYRGHHDAQFLVQTPQAFANPWPAGAALLRISKRNQASAGMLANRLQRFVNVAQSDADVGLLPDSCCGRNVKFAHFVSHRCS